jgi:hypothetical protein
MRLIVIVASVALLLVAIAAVTEARAEQLPGGGQSGRGNVYCTPDPLLLTFSNQDGTVSVYYSGGGSGLLYSYSIKFTWDATYAHTSVGPIQRSSTHVERALTR